MPSPSILVVDDNRDNLHLIEILLEDMDIELHLAHSGEEALSKAQHHDFAAALIDIQMPEMDGFECTSKLRSLDNNNTIPVIFLTAHMKDELDIDRGYQLGAIDYLIKPINEVRLKSKILSLINIYYDKKHISDKLNQTRKLHQSTEKLINSAGEGVLALDDKFRITFANTAACLLLTKSHNELIGKSVKEFVAPLMTDKEWLESSFIHIYKDGQCNHEDDSYFWRTPEFSFPVQYTQASIIENGVPVAHTLFFQDNTEHKEIEKKLINLANFDQLTQLPNRSYFFDFLNTMIENAKRREHIFATILIDLDNFKEVNDSHGHDAGDELLIQTAGRFKACLRQGDIAARLGGDEFAIILPTIKNYEDAGIVANKLILAMEQPFKVFNKEFHVNCSIGISLYPANADNVNTLMKQADTAMYDAKKHGKGNYRFFSSHLQKQLEDKIEISTELRIAVDKKSLIMFYQPQFDLKTKKIIGAEALVRWPHKQKGFIPPSSFIPNAEECNIIKDLTYLTFEQSLKQISYWQNNLTSAQQFSVAINLSAKLLKSNSTHKTLTSMINNSLIDPQQLHLELTESAVMEDPESAISILNHFRDLGIKISVDDFGTGYSSLSYLKRLPIDILKIDQQFVNGIGNSTNDEAIIKAIIQIAHSLELEVIAEGVETQAQLEFLLNYGCRTAQGYLLSPAVPAEQFSQLIIPK